MRAAARTAALIFLCAAPLRAGTLEDFEKAAAEKSQDAPAPRHVHSEYCDHGEDDGILSDLIGGLLAAPAQLSVARLEERQPGDPTLPFAAAAVRTQNVNSDVRALDFQAEFGYGPLGLDVRRTNFKEDRPADKLNVTQFHALYRISASRSFELDFGMGPITLHGKNRNTGLSFLGQIKSFPFPTPHVGFKLRPAWSRIGDTDIRDLDGAFFWTWRGLSLETGYRQLKAKRQKLQGPYIGLSLSY